VDRYLLVERTSTPSRKLYRPPAGQMDMAGSFYEAGDLVCIRHRRNIVFMVCGVRLSAAGTTLDTGHASKAYNQSCFLDLSMFRYGRALCVPLELNNIFGNAPRTASLRWPKLSMIASSLRRAS